MECNYCKPDAIVEHREEGTDGSERSCVTIGLSNLGSGTLLIFYGATGYSRRRNRYL